MCKKRIIYVQVQSLRITYNDKSSSLLKELLEYLYHTKYENMQILTTETDKIKHKISLAIVQETFKICDSN